MTMCEKCSKHEEYHTCSTCNQHLCINCFNTVHFGINAPRAGKSIIYNKCIFCGEIYGINAKVDVCDKCTIILSWVSELIKKNTLDSKLRNENYCKTKFGMHATQVIMDAVDSSSR